VISSLGHNMTLRGMYGTPRKLCTDTVHQLCRVAELLQPMNPIRLIAISTEGARPGFTVRPGFTQRVYCLHRLHRRPERPIMGCIRLALSSAAQ
tara:strand:+ start:582 stop:863 length:282 start_codon:yes stop_codon:yes gene_type:complete